MIAKIKGPIPGEKILSVFAKSDEEQICRGKLYKESGLPTGTFGSQMKMLLGENGGEQVLAKVRLPPQTVGHKRTRKIKYRLTDVGRHAIRNM